MLLTKQQKEYKYLEDAGMNTNGVSLFRFVNDGTATDEDKQNLIDMDGDYFDIYKEHIIVNVDEIAI